MCHTVPLKAILSVCETVPLKTGWPAGVDAAVAHQLLRPLAQREGGRGTQRTPGFRIRIRIFEFLDQDPHLIRI